MRFHLLTIFPDIFNSYLNESILKRAQEKRLVSFRIHNLRDWAADKHRSVDDSPYGGGAGMLMKIQPLHDALRDIKKLSRGVRPAKRRVVLLSASGRQWNQALARKYAKLEEVVLVCGRYEGVDARLREFIDEEISVGNYILTGGELPALTLIDSVVRLLPGALGNRASIVEESHAQAGLLEYPQYTRPEVFRSGRKRYAVPKVLLSGDHRKIQDWRDKKTRRSPKN